MTHGEQRVEQLLEREIALHQLAHRFDGLGGMHEQSGQQRHALRGRHHVCIDPTALAAVGHRLGRVVLRRESERGAPHDAHHVDGLLRRSAKRDS